MTVLIIDDDEVLDIIPIICGAKNSFGISVYSAEYMCQTLFILVLDGAEWLLLHLALCTRVAMIWLTLLW
jgi:hypothetical protein